MSDIFIIICVAVLAIGFLVCVIGWHLSVIDQGGLLRRVEIEVDAREKAFQGWRECQTKLDAAEKQIVDLQGITPGRDNTGRFVKRQSRGVHKQ